MTLQYNYGRRIGTLVDDMTRALVKYAWLDCLSECQRCHRSTSKRYDERVDKNLTRLAVACDVSTKQHLCMRCIDLQLKAEAERASHAQYRELMRQARQRQLDADVADESEPEWEPGDMGEPEIGDDDDNAD